jgi:putative ABC transport system permease protein
MTIPIVLRLAGRSISRRLLQSILFVAGVALGVAVMVAIDLANSASSRAFDLSAKSVAGRATHQIIAGSAGLSSDVYRQLRLRLGLREAAPIVEQYVSAVDLGGRPLRLLGVDPFAEPPFREYLSRIEVDGRGENAFEALNAFIASPNTALIAETLANRFGVSVGGSIRLRLASGQVDLRIIGLLRADDAASAEALDSLILTDIATAQELLGLDGKLTRIDLIVRDETLLPAIEALLPAGAVITTPRDRASALGQMTAAFELNLQALSLLALVVGVFLIYNTASFSVVQRRAMLGTLRALGATRRQIFALILSESLILGAFGTLIGLGLGVLFGRAAVGLVAQTISDLYFTVSVQRVSVDGFTLLKGALIGVGASLGAALVPSIDATLTPPIGSMRRSALEESARRLLPIVTAAALALCGAGALLLTIPTESLIISFGALFAVVVGGALLTPLALVGAMRLAVPVGSALFGILGRMAPRAVARSLSRTSVAVAALTVAVSTIVGVSVMIASFRNTVANWLDMTLGADIYISPPQVTATQITANVDPALAARVAAVPGVARVVTGRNVDLIAPDYPDLPPVRVIAAAGEVVAAERPFLWLNAPDGDYWAALEAGALVVSEPFAFRRGITPENAQITLLTDRGERVFPIVGVYYDYSTDQGNALMADSVYRRFYDDPFITSMAVFLQPDADLNAVLEAIRSQALADTELLAQSNRSLRSGVFDVFERTFAITGALRMLAVVVAFIGILSALMALQLEQTRQYGTMRAVGMTPRQLWRFTLLQTGLMGGTAGLLALPIGAALAWVLIYVINLRSFGWTLQLTLTADEFALAFIVALTAALLAGLYPAGRLTRLVTAQALRAE